MPKKAVSASRTLSLPAASSPGEAEEIVGAIRSGQVDAFVVYQPEGQKIFVLQPADYPYRMVLDAMTSGAVALAPDTTMLYCNSRFAELMGTTATALVGQHFRKFVRTQDRHAFSTMFQQGFHQAARSALRLRSLQGEDVPVATSVSPLALADTPAVCLIASEVGPQHNVERELRDVTQFLAQIISSAREGIIVLDDGNRIRVWNKYMEEITGVAADKAVGMTLADLCPNDTHRLAKSCSQARRGATVTREFDFSVKETGRSGIVSVAFSRVRSHLTGVLGIVREITEEKKAEEQLRKTAEQLRSLTTRLLKVREQESLRISRELHDEMGGNLTAMKIELGGLEDCISNPAALKRRLANTTRLLDSTLRSVQRIAKELRPPILEELGLIPALKNAAGEFTARTRIPCEIRGQVSGRKIPSAVAVALFRIFQECLTNVARHAQATRVVASLQQHSQKMTLLVQDNGVGFCPRDADRRRSLGLLGMKERALSVGGALTVESAPRKGTIVSVWVPLRGN